MVVEAYIGMPFDYPHERQAADVLLRAMKSNFHSKPETYFLLQNISIYGTQIDFILLKPKAIIVIELKEMPNPFTASENGDWISGNKIFDNNGSNPYHQIQDCREKFIQFFEKNRSKILIQKEINIRHTSGFVCISPSIHKKSEISFENTSIPWFKLIGLDEAVGRIEAQVSNQLNLTEVSYRRLIKLLNLHPAKNTLLQGSFISSYRKNLDFTGRENELTKIHDHFSLEENRSKAVVVTGIGGIGKTQLCIQYAYEYRADYPNGVFWINASGDLVEEFAQVARKLEIKVAVDELGNSSEILAGRFLKMINGTPDVLLILDNINDPTILYKPIMGEFILISFLCCKLITARDFSYQFSDVFRLKLKPFGDEEAISYVSKILGVQTDEQENRLSGRLLKEREQIKKLCMFFGNHPFALNLSVSAVKSKRFKLEDYLTRLFAEGSISTLDAFKVFNTDTFVDYKISDLLEWHWEKFNLLTRKVLCLFTFFPDEKEITEEKIVRYLHLMTEIIPGYPDQFSDTLVELVDLSLIQRMGFGMVTVHPLIKEFCKRKNQITNDLKIEIAQNLFALYSSPSKMEHLIQTAGIFDVKEDLRFCQTLLTKDQIKNDFSLIEDLYRIFLVNSDKLLDTSVDDPPGYIKQEIRNGAFDLGFQKTSLLYEADLCAAGEPWLCKKYSSQETEKGFIQEYRDDGTSISCFSLSGKNTRIVSGNTNGKINIWDVASGTLQNSIETGMDIDSLQLSPSGVHAVLREMIGVCIGENSGFELIADPQIEIWDLLQKRRISCKPCDANEAYKIINDYEVLFGTNSGEIVRCSLVDGVELGRVKIGKSRIVDIDSSNKLIAILDDESQIAIIEKKDFRFLRSFAGPKRVFKDIKLIQDDHYLVGCFVNYDGLAFGYGFDSEKFDGTKVGDLLIWDLREKILIKHFELEGPYADMLRDIKCNFSEGSCSQTIERYKLPDLISSSSKGHWVVVHWVNDFLKIDFNNLLKEPIYLDSVSCFEVSESGDVYFGFINPSAMHDPFSVLLFGHELVRPIVSHLYRVNQISFSQDEKKVYTASDDGSIKSWDTDIIKTKIPKMNPTINETEVENENYNPWDYSKIQYFGFSKNEDYVFLISSWNEVQVRCLETGEILYRKELNEFENFFGRSFSETIDGRGLIINGEDSVIVWNYQVENLDRFYLPTKGRLIKCVQLEEGNLIALIDKTDFSINDDVSYEPVFEVSDLSQSTSLYEINTAYCADIFSSKNGGWLFYYGRDGFVNSEDLLTRKKKIDINNLKLTNDEAMRFQLNNTGNRLSITFGNGVKEMYDLDARKLILSKAYEDMFADWSLDNSCDTVVSSYEHDAVIIWKSNSGKCLAKLNGIGNVEISGSGRFAAAVDYYGVLHVYELVN